MKSCSAVGEENLLVAVLAAGPELRQMCAGVDLDRRQQSTQDCSWYQRKPVSAGPASRPAPLIGANTEPLNTQQRPENVNQVANNNNNNNYNRNNNAGPSRQNEYREPHQSYMV